MIREAIQQLVEEKDLSSSQAEEAMREIMSGVATQAQMGAFLAALKMKGESVGEIVSFAKVMKEFCPSIEPMVKGRIVDTCGTGGDSLKTFNVSTIAAFVVSGVGLAVAKHGNRSVTSPCGSADLLEGLGVKLEQDPQTVKSTIEKIGVGFLFAPRFHSAMKQVAQPRKEIGIRTVFNILGPLTNPVKLQAQVMGVYDPSLLVKVAESMKAMGREEAMVVHGSGMDEISTFSSTTVAWLKNGEIVRKELKPSDFNVRPARVEEIPSFPDKGGYGELAFRVLYTDSKKEEASRDLVLVNASAALVVGGKADSLSEAVEMARGSILSGSAYSRLNELVKLSGGSMENLEALERKYRDG